MTTLLATAWSAPGAQRPEAAPASLGGGWSEDGRCWRGILWGEASWFEPRMGKVLRQELDFFPVERRLGISPLIIYIHPPRDTHTIHPAHSTLYGGLVQAARASGFSLASVEYRHPSPDDPVDPAPNNDITLARRWVHAHARQLGVDVGNVFLVDQSHGTLGLRTALHDRRDPALRVNAAYSHLACTTGRGVELTRRFVVDGNWLAFDDPVAPEKAYDGVVPFFQRHLR